MRKIINISLPEELEDEVERAIKKGKFATKSEFFRALIRNWESILHFEELEESRKEMKGGKKKLLNSLHDLR